VDHIRLNGTATNILSDLLFSTSAPNPTILLESTNLSGTPYFIMKTRGTSQASIYQTNGGWYFAAQSANLPIVFSVNDSGTTRTPLHLYGNGVVKVGTGANNKLLSLYETGGTADTPSTATNFYGFGVNSATLRYQVSLTSATHKFYCGTTLAYTITNAGGANGSDARWKTDVQDLTGALAKINQLQPRSFILNGGPGRQIGFIAQEVKPIVPEVVVVDLENDPDQYHFLQYDKLTALLCAGIKELLSEVNSLKTRIAVLEGNPS